MPFVIAFLLLVAAIAITLMLTPTNKQKPALLSEFNLPVPDEGTPQIVIFGDVWLDDWFVVWYGNLRSQAISSGK
jgi:hypothetical protein